MRALLGAVAHRGRHIAVHHGLAGDDRHATPSRRREQRLGALLVDRGEDHRRSGAVGDQPVEEFLRRGRGVAAVAIAGLFRKGKAAQPVEQILSRRRQHAVLGEVDMGIDEARQDQAVAEVIDRARAIGLRQGAMRAAPQDAPVIADDDSTLAARGHILAPMLRKSGQRP